MRWWITGSTNIPSLHDADDQIGTHRVSGYCIGAKSTYRRDTDLNDISVSLVVVKDT